MSDATPAPVAAEVPAPAPAAAAEAPAAPAAEAPAAPAAAAAAAPAAPIPETLPIPAETSPRKLLVVLGASYAGVSTAHYLLRHVVPALADPAQYQVVLVSPSADIVSRPAMPRALLSDAALDMKRVLVPIASVLEQYPAGSWRFLHGSATALDHAARRVMVRPHGDMAVPEELLFHALVIATGASTRSPLLGLTTDSDALRASWAALREALPAAKSIVVGGGGPAAVETAGELGQHLNGKLGLFKRKPKVQITVVSAGEQILPVLRPALGLQAEKLLARVGVTVRKGVAVASTEPAASGTAAAGPSAVATKTVVTLADGTALDADIYIPATGWSYNTAFVDPALLQDDGRVKVNPTTLRVEYGEHAAIGAAPSLVYAAGDVSSAHRPAIHNILESVRVLGANMKRDLLRAQGTPAADLPAERAYTENTKEMQLVPIGTTGGVGAAMGMKLPGFAVKLIKGRDYFLWTTPRLWSGAEWTAA